ncbi:MAG: ferritin family protein [Candidatus Aminicenantes bacterium]|nr:ferritin family protein [Candidatus Aminicenantes bacterium]
MSKKTFTGLDEVFSFAIEREEQAAELYSKLREKAAGQALKTLAEELRLEEIQHKRILLELKTAGRAPAAQGVVVDLGVSDYTVDEPLRPDMTVPELLLFAAKKELQAALLYEGLAGRATSGSERRTFEFLAAQEKTHKLRLESEYEANVLTEN